LVLVFVGAIFPLQIALAETIMGWLGVRNIFNLNLPRSFIDLSVLGNSYGFCVASVRALYQKAAAMALAAEAQAATASHPRQSRYRACTAGRPTSSAGAAGD
jgi:hypothetical protein